MVELVKLLKATTSKKKCLSLSIAFVARPFWKTHLICESYQQFFEKLRTFQSYRIESNRTVKRRLMRTRLPFLYVFF